MKKKAEEKEGWERRALLVSYIFKKGPLYDLTVANRVIPGSAVSYLEASTGMLRLPENPCKLR